MFSCNRSTSTTGKSRSSPRAKKFLMRAGGEKSGCCCCTSSRVFVAKGGYAQKPFTLMGDGEISLRHNISHAPLYLYVHSGWMKQSVLLSSAASPTPRPF